MTRRTKRWAIGLLLPLVAGCVQKHMHMTDCGFDASPAPGNDSRVTWTHTALAGRLDGRIRETGHKTGTVRHASVLLPEPGTFDTVHVPVDSDGTFHVDSMPSGRRKVIVAARWYWAAFDTIEFRPDSGVHAEVQLAPTPQGWYGCIPH